MHATQGLVTDQPLVRNGRTFTVNHQGSTTTLTDGAGQVVQSYSYGPFGETSQSTGEANPFQYAGRENDGATGLYYHRARYYRPEWGRFLSADPIGFEGGLNHYTYGFNNPLSGTDPSGTYFETALDIAGLAYDVGEFIRNPSFWNGAAVVVDIISLGLPTPGVGAIRLGSQVLRNGDNIPIGMGPDDGVDIALGLTPFIRGFSEATGGRYYLQWPGFNAMPFDDLFVRMADQAPVIHFNLQGMDMPRAFNYQGPGYPFDWTNWEFQQILNNPIWFDKTRFYNLPQVP